MKRLARIRLERLDGRCLPAVIIPSGDLAEGNAANWSTFAADNAPTSISNDTSKVATGAMWPGF